jgi:hypothetical protein
MRIAEGFTRSRTSRLVWGGLTIVAVLGLAFAYQAEQQALDDELHAAQERGTTYASSVIYEAVESPSLASTDVNLRFRTLYVAVQGGIFTDPTVARVRLWDVEGVLLFSTDQPRSGVGVLQVQDPAVIQAATEGRVTSSHTTVPFTFATTGTEGEPTRLLQTFSPLRVPDRIDPLGAVQIDFLYEPLVERARLAWLPYQVILAALAAAFGFLTVLSFRRPALAGSTERVVVTSGGDDMGHGEVDPPAVAIPVGAEAAEADRDAAALREELQVAREQLAQAEEAYHYLETRWKESQEALKRFEGQEPPDVEARVAELQDALRRSEAEITLLAARLDSGNDEAMARLVEADQARSRAEARAAAAEARIAELERAAADHPEPASETGSASETEPTSELEPEGMPVTPNGELFGQLEERLEAAEQRARQEDDAAELSTEASALRARLARTAARKKLGPSSDG